MLDYLYCAGGSYVTYPIHQELPNSTSSHFPMAREIFIHANKNAQNIIDMPANERQTYTQGKNGPNWRTYTRLYIKAIYGLQYLGSVK